MPNYVVRCATCQRPLRIADGWDVFRCYFCGVWLKRRPVNG